MMRKAICVVTLLAACFFSLYGQSLQYGDFSSPPPSASLQRQLAVNGCGSANGIKWPDFIFKQACDAHDIGYGTLGRPKSVTDATFYTDMIQACRDTFGRGLSSVLFNQCVELAGTYFLAVHFFGGSAYGDAQTLARRLRDAIVSESICYPGDIFVAEYNGIYFISFKANG
jgi:hypothetical protein